MATRAPSARQLQAVVAAYLARQSEINLFRKQVVDFFETSVDFTTTPLRAIHSVKSRLKDPLHLEDKIRRKLATEKITPENLFKKINDLAGVRVLHLHTNQFSEIHAAIINHLAKNYWSIAEKPIAYSWDPETTAYFKSLGLKAQTRDTYYTSVHYVVKPHAKSDISCEIQVRTLFEEIWGELDHAINYPKETPIVACREQLRVLAKLSSTGTRLVDSIFKISHIEN